MGRRPTKHTLGYHTKSKTPTSEMPFFMVYGTKFVIPLDIGMLSFMISNLDKLNNEIELRLNLDLFDGKRE